MNDERLQRLYREGLAARARAAGEEVPLEELEALVAGTLPEGRRAALLDRVMSDPDLLQEFELLRAVHRAGEVDGADGPEGDAAGGGAGSGAGPVPRRAMGFVPLAVAAAAVLVLGTSIVLRSPRGPEPPRMRGGEEVGAVASRAPADGATVAVPVVLVWSPVPDAVAYRVEVIDGEGAVAFRDAVADPLLSLPVGALTAGAAYRWWVEAVRPDGTAQSELRTFVVEP